MTISSCHNQLQHLRMYFYQCNVDYYVWISVCLSASLPNHVHLSFYVSNGLSISHSLSFDVCV